MSVLVALAACGCGGRTQLDLLETRLRQQEDVIYRARSELAAAQTDLELSRKETEALRAQLARRGQAAALPEQTAARFRATALQINKLLTGGLNRDDHPGDDALNVAVVPVDADGEPVKVPGTVSIELLDMAQPESRRRIGQWDFPLEQAAEQWQATLIGSGYRFLLPWKTRPEHSELLVHARLTTTDGRQFDTTHSVRITPPGPGSQLAAQASARSALPPPPAPPVEPAPPDKRTPPAEPARMPPVAEGSPPIRQLSAEQPAPDPLPLTPSPTGNRKRGDRTVDLEALWQTPPPAAPAPTDAPPPSDPFDWRKQY